MQRLEILKNQLSSKAEALELEDPRKLLQKYRAKSTIDANELRSLCYGHYGVMRKRVFDILLSEPTIKQYTVTESNRKELREQNVNWMNKFKAKFGPITYEDYKKDTSIISFFTNSLFEFDGALAVKFAAHYNLYTKTLINLGTEKHRPFIDRALAMEDIGCFGLTELGHGSNAKGILTRADYDVKTGEFIINTPNDLGMKFWIGAAANLANMCTVMAQLYIGDKNYGVNSFIVPIRNKKDHTLLPGVIVGDCGLKVGMDGIDNGFLIFKNVRIPYDNLLDKFSSIVNGKFKSPVKSADKRFGLTLGSLSGGRIQFTDGANSMMRNALTIAIRYATCRRQFGSPGQPEMNILEYPLTQYRLMPYLAESLLIGIAHQNLLNTWNSNQDNIFKENNPLLMETHSLSSVLKPIITWLAQKCIQECREVCGGLGYSAYNRLGQLSQENDINATWEGDNNILLQQTAKFLMDSLRKLKAGEQLPFPSLSFLKDEFDPNQRLELVDGKSAFTASGYDIKKALEVKANFMTHASFEHFQKNMMDSEDAWHAWNKSHVFYLKEAAFAYGEAYLFTEFGKRMELCVHQGTQNVLRKISDLYGFNKLEKNMGTFFEMGYFSREDIVYIRQRITDLCRELKDEAVGLIDAIAIPDELLNSPIGASDGDVYNRFLNAVWTAPGVFEKPSYWKEIHREKKI